jgi:hypothetical protein
MRVVARPISQGSVFNGATACTAIATVFCITVHPLDIETADFNTVIKLGAQLWATWHEARDAKLRGNYCEAYDLIEGVPFLGNLLKKNQVEYSICSGYIVDTPFSQHARFAEECSAVYIRDAFKTSICPGTCAVFTVGAKSIAVTRPPESDGYYMFDSHACALGGNGEYTSIVLFFENVETFLSWLFSVEGFGLDAQCKACGNVNDLFERASGPKAQEATILSALARLSYTLTVFRIERGRTATTTLAPAPEVVNKSTVAEPRPVTPLSEVQPSVATASSLLPDDETMDVIARREDGRRRAAADGSTIILSTSFRPRVPHAKRIRTAAYKAPGRSASIIRDAPSGGSM